MKKIKINLSKTSWIILSVGVFIVVLAGLGVTYSQQAKEKEEAEQQLELTEMRLDMFNIPELESQKKEMEASVADAEKLYDLYRANLIQSVISSDVVEKCYEIADDSNVQIINIGSSVIKVISFSGVRCVVTNVNIRVSGTLPDYMVYMTNLNEDFTTGYVYTTQIILDDNPEDDNSEATIQLMVYSYEGE